MLEALSAAALSELGAVLSDEAAFRAAGSAEAYSAVLARWLVDACAREQGVRRGETHHGPLLMPRLAPLELARAQTFAAALAMAFANLGEFTTAATRQRYETLASEIEPAMLNLAEALSVLAEPASAH